MSDNNKESKNVDAGGGVGSKSSPLTYVFAFIFIGISTWIYSKLEVSGIWAILNAIGSGALLTFMLAVLAAIAYGLLHSASDPYRLHGGVKGVLGTLWLLLIMVLLLDGAYSYGTFTFVPVVEFINSGSFKDTYWGCSGEWVFYDEGYGECEN